MQNDHSSPGRGNSRSSGPINVKSTTHRRPVRSTAVRRDEHRPRQIRSNINSANTIYGRESGLRPVRDAGLSLQTRREKRRIQQEKRAIRNAIIIFSIFAIVVVAGLTWMYSSNVRGKALARNNSELTPAKSRGTSNTSGKMASIPVIQASTMNFTTKQLKSEPTEENFLKRAAALGISAVTPTPQFASFGDIKICLPVGVDDLTEVGFHRASFTYAQVMSTTLAIANADTVKQLEGTERDKSLQKVGKGELLMGSTFDMPRSRNTKRRTAVDLGAPAGSLVVAPITGKIMKVKLYDYEGRVSDYEIHIQPDGYPNLEVVLIHIENPIVKVGDRVEAGVTPMAMVRKMSTYVKNQLADYSGTDGNHVHMQVNKIDEPSYIKRHADDDKIKTDGENGS